MAVSKKYTKLSEIENFQSGYIIICDTLFEVLHRSVISSWDLYAKSIEKKVMEARRIANIRNTQQIVVDDINVFDEYIVASEGELISAYQAYLKMEEKNHDSFIKKCLGP